MKFENQIGLTDQEQLAQLAELFISGPVKAVTYMTRAVGAEPSISVSIDKTTHHKCGRCWRHLPEVTEDGALCGRCAEVLA